ncbi:MAG TPA: Gfo/Idh/MocA family oxidoreductase [Phycisphaerae bacterium]|jgi:predicted dehydrogenase|nr:Gfo/Idh/MocA family oxidoreductase [Phycisphaerae bacterium]HOB74289.1 Gfo/Idh/MocA family oxidoreductase [Phycisphaerae bacterium]HOJ53120.1 Gfo/Idh/MocA family oxidoreductase [Phycisphaerae bacterium]HOL24857.1 Gfo/Idh/MocA family oxidoreductase [Phycisphaerae bacterium]HPP19393.1 Gfo/Idh/MocA family oxidoreductase [Phycisphaerae bacterium]
MSRLNRRRFLQNSAAVAGGILFTAPARSFGRVLGANDTIRVAVAGINGRGQEHIGALLDMKDVEIACLVDPDKRIWNKSIQRIEQKTGKAPKAVQDIREALEDKNLDAVSIATPNHWHALMTIWACQAGKDVYVEKPCSHNVHEGRIAVEAARRYGRIVQHGTQHRSNPKWAAVAAAVKSGKYGKLLIARGIVYKRRDSIGFKQPTDVPEGLDFNIWLGPAPQQPYHENLVHYNWHWFWDTGNGDIGNQGVHQMDIARWCIGGTLPKSVISMGGRFGYEDQGQTANTQLTIMDFGDAQLIFEVRGLPSEPYHGQGSGGNVMHLTEGIIAGTSFIPKGKSKPEPISGVEVKLGPGKGDHFRNFIEAMRSRRQADLNADIQEGHYSSALCHLANISYRLGELTPWYKKTKTFGENKDAYEALARMEEHLGANGVKFDGLQYRMGRKLVIDAQTEGIVDDAEAQAMLTRKYREPFVVPEKIA